MRIEVNTAFGYGYCLPHLFELHHLIPELVIEYNYY